MRSSFYVVPHKTALCSHYIILTPENQENRVSSKMRNKCRRAVLQKDNKTLTPIAFHRKENIAIVVVENNREIKKEGNKKCLRKV